MQDLRHFAEDLGRYSGVEAQLTEDTSADGLHVLTINGVDYYFQADTGGYDGWGKCIQGEVRKPRQASGTDVVNPTTSRRPDDVGASSLEGPSDG